MRLVIFPRLLAVLVVSGLLASVPGAMAAPRETTPEAAATLVVYNRNDPDSAELARFYARQRSIPKEHVLGLSCPLKEEISRAEYDTTIAGPLREAFSKNGWWDLRAIDNPISRVERNRIRFVALIRGVPLKIAVTANYPGDQIVGLPQLVGHNEASVDSELAVLGTFSSVIAGTRANPYFRSYTPILDANLPDLLLVARLDAPTPAIVRRMITDGLAAEDEGLRGFAYVDARNVTDPGLGEGDKWLNGIARAVRREGLPVIFDNGEGLFPEGYPMRQTALYFGWYAEHLSGPFVRPDFRFVPGAVAVHIHSYSAISLRDPKKNWCAPLLAAGAAATLGNVYEPFLALTPQLDVFQERLARGFTLAESAWMSVRVASWQTTVVGDPLYRPFKVANDATRPPGSSEWDRYQAGARIWFTESRPAGAAALQADAKRLKSGLISEGLGLLDLSADGAQEEALSAFQEARQNYTLPEDILRAAIHEVILLRSLKREDASLALARKMIAAYPKAPACEVLRLLEPRAAPAAAGSAPR